jgi:NAD(P)-dependent dehydrogenase (short-subunit alcohol dehydrogenase family)
MSNVRKLDLSSFYEVSKLATSIQEEISSGTLPRLAAVICNAFYWNLALGGPQFSLDDYELTFAINHLAHFSLVLRLLGSFEAGVGGRIVLINSDIHRREKTNPLQKIPEWRSRGFGRVGETEKGSRRGRECERYLEVWS